MNDLSPTHATARITTLLDAPESRTIDFNCIGSKHGGMNMNRDAVSLLALV